MLQRKRNGHCYLPCTAGEEAGLLPPGVAPFARTFSCPQWCSGEDAHLLGGSRPGDLLLMSAMPWREQGYG